MRKDSVRGSVLTQLEKGARWISELTSHTTAFLSQTWAKAINFFPPSVAKPTPSLAPVTAMVSQWTIYNIQVRVTSLESTSALDTLLLKSFLWLPIVLSTKSNLFALIRFCMMGPLPLSPALASLPSLIPISLVTFQLQTHQAFYCLDKFTDLFCVPRIRSPS